MVTPSAPTPWPAPVHTALRSVLAILDAVYVDVDSARIMTIQLKADFCRSWLGRALCGRCQKNITWRPRGHSGHPCVANCTHHGSGSGTRLLFPAHRPPEPHLEGEFRGKGALFSFDAHRLPCPFRQSRRSYFELILTVRGYFARAR